MFFLICILFAGFAACKSKPEVTGPDFLVKNIDTSVSPAEDFFGFANGGWIKNNPIPASESGWGCWAVGSGRYLRSFKKRSTKKAALEKS